MNKSLTESSKEYKEKLLLKKKIEEYCQKESVKNGLNDLEKIKKYLPEKLLFRHLRRNIVIAHLDFEKVLSEIMKTGKFTVVSGLNPSSGLHYGHKLLFDLLLELQNLGADVFIPITNDETYLDNKSNSLGGSRDIALKEVVPSIIALGFNSKRTHIFVDTEYPEIYKFAIKISKYVSTADVNKLFGREAINNPGQVFYRGCVQLAQILLPQLPEFGGPKLTLIPVGIDQHPYVLLARDVAKKMNLVPPAELVIKFQPSLLNPEKKMSKSDPSTAIFLSDNKVVIKEKIQKAYTGTVSSRESHNKFGGIPEICTVFALLNSQCLNDNLVLNLYKDYKNGTLMASKLKNIVGEMLININDEYQQKLKQINQTKIKQFILNKKLVSVYDP